MLQSIQDQPDHLDVRGPFGQDEQYATGHISWKGLIHELLTTTRVFRSVVHTVPTRVPTDAAVTAARGARLSGAVLTAAATRIDMGTPQMTRNARLLIASLLVALAAAACGPGTPAASAPPRAATFDEFGTAYCAAWDELFTAIGNPDTGSDSAMHAAFEKAVTAGDGANVERLARTINAHLATGRGHLVVASGWSSAGPLLSQMDRVFVAFAAMTEARRSGADAQTAFESAGGVVAWQAMLEAGRTFVRPADAGSRQCPTVPVSY